MSDPALLEVWRAVSAMGAFALAFVLMARHVFESHLDLRTRRILDLVALPLFAIFATYLVARHFA